MILELKTQLAIQAHAKKEYPKESCGLVQIFKGRQRYVECHNEAETNDHFVLSAKDYAAAEDEGEIIAIVHSHPDTAPEPSQADKVSCEASQLTWIIVNWPTGKINICEPSGYEAPLIGREFLFGVLDCYSLIRDYYQRELNISLPDYERQDGFWKRGENLYMDFYKDAGFISVIGEPLKENDIILMRIDSLVPNHGGVLLGDGKILHHVAGRLSSRDVYGQHYRDRTIEVVRHKSFI